MFNIFLSGIPIAFIVIGILNIKNVKENTIGFLISHLYFMFGCLIIILLWKV